MPGNLFYFLRLVDYLVGHVVLHDILHEKEKEDMKKGAVAGKAGLMVAVGMYGAGIRLVVFKEEVEAEVCVRVDVREGDVVCCHGLEVVLVGVLLCVKGVVPTAKYSMPPDL